MEWILCTPSPWWSYAELEEQKPVKHIGLIYMSASKVMENLGSGQLCRIQFPPPKNLAAQMEKMKATHLVQSSHPKPEEKNTK